MSYKSSHLGPDVSINTMKCATLGRSSSIRRFISVGGVNYQAENSSESYGSPQCDVVVTRGAGGQILVSGTDIPDKILWKFDDITNSGVNNPDVVSGSTGMLPDAVVSRTTTL